MSTEPFLCNERSCYEVETSPSEPNTFFSCGEDGTVRLAAPVLCGNCDFLWYIGKLTILIFSLHPHINIMTYLFIDLSTTSSSSSCTFSTSRAIYLLIDLPPPSCTNSPFGWDNLLISFSSSSPLRWYDLRLKSSCKKRGCLEDVLISEDRGITTIDLHPTKPWIIAAGCSDSKIKGNNSQILFACKIWKYCMRNASEI